MVLWTLKSFGTDVIFWPISFRTFSSTPVLPRRGSSASPPAFNAGPAAVEPVGLVRLVALAGFVLGFEPRAPIGLHLVDFAFGDDAFADQLLRIEIERGRMRADLLVHQRLRESRLVAFVVAEAAIAEHVDDDRLLELLPEFGRDLGGEHHRFRIVAIGVEDRRLDHLRHVGRIGRRARIARIGREADLVVDDEMQGAAGAVALQRREAETFRHHALAGEGRVAVDEQRHHHGAVCPASRPADPAWRALCRAPPDRRFRDARDSARATDAPCCRRTRDPTTRPGDTSRRRSLRLRPASQSRP